MLDQMPLPGCDCDEDARASDMIDIETARVLAVSLVGGTARSERVPLDQALGRTSAVDVVGALAMPGFDNSAMDGFAIRIADLGAARSLPIAGCIAAGDSAPDLPHGSALRIYTGAPLPGGADAVLKVEDTIETNGNMTAPGLHARPGQNIRRAGSDQPSGSCLLKKGQRIAAHHIGLLAANAITQVDVASRSCVGVMSTGNELRPDVATGARVYDANRPMLLALAGALGAETIDLGIVPDTAEDTTKALREAAPRCDLILTSGAVSMGGKDHMRDAVLSAGGQIDGWRVAIKPGKPVMFGHIGETVVTGLPGNPFAAFVGFHLFAAAQIGAMTGAHPGAEIATPAVAAFEWTRKPGRAEVFPVRLRGYTSAGAPRLERLGQSVSATLFPLSDADGIACVSRDTADVTPGDALLWQPFSAGGQVR